MANYYLDLGEGQSVEVVRETTNRETELIYPTLRQAGDVVVALLRAHRALALADSWRGFRVAACAITQLDESGTVSYINGVNKKPQQEGPVDIHAEEEVLANTVHLGRRPINVLSVVADIQPDQSTLLTTPTLLPCFRRCLPRLLSSPHVLPETLIVSAPPDLSCAQYYDVATLQNAYDTNDPNLLTTVHFDVPYDEDLLEWREEWRSKLMDRVGRRALEPLFSMSTHDLMNLPL